MKNIFKGKSALVTNAAQGVGREIALTLARAGARLLIVDGQAEGLNETLAAILERHGEAHAACADLAQPGEPERLLAQARTLYGKLDYACFSVEDGVMRIARVA